MEGKIEWVLPLPRLWWLEGSASFLRGVRLRGVRGGKDIPDEREGMLMGVGPALRSGNENKGRLRCLASSLA
jgi:hypothetical protein